MIAAEAASGADASDVDAAFVAGPKGHHVDLISRLTGCRPEGLTSGYCNAITALAHLPGSDILASGSGDGFIRLWQLVQFNSAPGAAGVDDAAATAADTATASLPMGRVAFRSLRHVAALPLRGIVNGLAFTHDGTSLVAAVGQEHRLGRWWRYADAQNGIALARMPVPKLKNVAN
jgi:ribosomal RNA-processing protein 9